MSWKDEYNKALTAFIVKHGSPVTDGRRISLYSGWMAEDYAEIREHLDTCMITKSRIDDSEWDEFMGTFAEPSVQVQHGVDAVVTCVCGQIQGRAFRFTGTFSELVQGVLNESED
jgi:hypothetical protein